MASEKLTQADHHVGACPGARWTQDREEGSLAYVMKALPIGNVGDAPWVRQGRKLIRDSA